MEAASRSEDHAQRVMDVQAHIACGHGTANTNATLPAATMGTIHRDEAGGL